MAIFRELPVPFNWKIQGKNHEQLTRLTLEKILISLDTIIYCLKSKVVIKTYLKVTIKEL